jgi:hypothetical protein
LNSYNPYGVENAVPAIKHNLRRIPMHKKQEVKELLNDMLEREVIRPSNSPWSSPIVLVIYII